MTIDEKEVINLNEIKEKYMEALGERVGLKRREKYVVTISKVK